MHHDRLQVLVPSTVVWSPARLLILMTALSTQLTGSQSFFMELLLLSKLQQCEVEGTYYNVSSVRALALSPLSTNASQYMFLLTSRTGEVFV